MRVKIGYANAVMRKVLVLQHVAHEILGTLNPILKENKLKIRYVNFEREPDAQPEIDGYNGLVVLGGPMGVYEAPEYPHLVHEMKLIEQAFKMDIPVLGICLGAQLMAHVLGGKVGPHFQKEVGWHTVDFLQTEGTLFQGFEKQEMIFQLHGDSFEVPKSCQHLASSEICPGQVFQYGEKAYALQFHIEVDEPMVKRWLKVPVIAEDIKRHTYIPKEEEILNQTKKHIERSMQLSGICFRRFVELFGLPERPELLGSK